MRVCPKCGYHDKPCWRIGFHMLYSGMEICRIDELEEWEKKIAVGLNGSQDIDKRGNKFFKTLFHAYKLTKKGWVYRTSLELFNAFHFQKAKIEKYVKPIPKEQRKLI